MKIVYHGSKNGELKELEARISTHQRKCIYATRNKVVSMLFMGKGKGDLDTMIATIDGQLTLVERREGVLNSLYNTDGYIYELDGSTFSHYDYLWSQEVISFENSLVPLSKTHYKNILEALLLEEEKGNLKIYKYPTRPRNVPLDNSDLIDKYIDFELQGLTGAVKDLLEVYPEFTEIVKEKMNEKNQNKLKNS